MGFFYIVLWVLHLILQFVHFKEPQNPSVGALSRQRPGRDILCVMFALSIIRLNPFDVY